MILKIAGAVLIISAGALVGRAKLQELKRHVRLLADMSGALGEMKSEICMLFTPLPQLFSQLTESGPGETRRFFGYLSEKIEEEPLADIWISASEKLQMPEEERAVVSRLSSTIGRYDAELQGAELDLARMRLEAFLEQAKTEQQTRGKTFMGLGLSIGALLAVILI